MSYADNPWLYIPQPRADAEFRLICFHHAGGGAYSYRSWPRLLRPDIEMIAIQLPGREGREHEPAMHALTEVLDSIDAALTGWLDRPYALFGHSMGAHLAYRLACRIRQRAEPGPVHIFLSAAAAPDPGEERAREFEEALNDLSAGKILEQLARFGDVPEALTTERSHLKRLEPLYRGDVSLMAKLQAEPTLRLDCRFSLLTGSEDREVGPQDVAPWRALTDGAVRSAVFRGGHFYLRTNEAALIRSINLTL